MGVCLEKLIAYDRYRIETSRSEANINRFSHSLNFERFNIYEKVTGRTGKHQGNAWSTKGALGAPHRTHGALFHLHILGSWWVLRETAWSSYSVTVTHVTHFRSKYTQKMTLNMDVGMVKWKTGNLTYRSDPPQWQIIQNLKFGGVYLVSFCEIWGFKEYIKKWIL